MRQALVAGSLLIALQAAAVAETPTDRGPQLGDAHTSEYQIGVIINSSTGPCVGLFATAPVPVDWPEQSVKVVNEETTPFVRQFGYRMVDTVKQMLVQIPQLPAGQEARALVTVEITRHTQKAPEDTSIYRLPKKLPLEVKKYLGDSPYIETRHAKIRALAKELTKEEKPAWETVEGIYDVVREKVKYQEGPLKGAIRALQDGTGDCEELSSLFIAICRAANIPARTVWVPGHCYAEFYLEDEDGNGYWFPCQPAGAREFGGISETRPILQKGDDFRVPERPRDRQRYVAEFLTGRGGSPTVRFVREVIE